MNAAPVTKAVLTTQECYIKVGGRPFFEQLLDAYPEILKPIRICKSATRKANGDPGKGKHEYLLSVVEQALKAAQMDRRFAK